MKYIDNNGELLEFVSETTFNGEKVAIFEDYQIRAMSDVLHICNSTTLGQRVKFIKSHSADAGLAALVAFGTLQKRAVPTLPVHPEPDTFYSISTGDVVSVDEYMETEVILNTGEVLDRDRFNEGFARLLGVHEACGPDVQVGMLYTEAGPVFLAGVVTIKCISHQGRVVTFSFNEGGGGTFTKAWCVFITKYMPVSTDSERGDRYGLS